LRESDCKLNWLIRVVSSGGPWYIDMFDRFTPQVICYRLFAAEAPVQV